MLKLDLSKLATFLPQDYAAQRQDRLAKAAQMLDTHTGPGGDFTGWVYLPRDYDKEEFARFNKIEISPGESYSANCIWVNGTVLVPAGYPAAKAAIEKAGYPVIEVDTSEFRKIDGGLSCLSLRF